MRFKVLFILCFLAFLVFRHGDPDSPGFGHVDAENGIGYFPVGFGLPLVFVRCQQYGGIGHAEIGKLIGGSLSVFEMATTDNAR